MFKIGQRVALTEQGHVYMSQEHKSTEYDMFIVKTKKNKNGLITCTNILNDTDYPFFEYEIQPCQYNPTLIDKWELSK